MKRVVVTGEHWRLDLTESQERVLQPGKRIGCGLSACAYERPDGRVVKFTQDDRDIAGAMKGQGCGMVRVDGAYRLPQIVNGEPVFASVSERLARLRADDPRRKWLDKARHLVGDFAFEFAKPKLYEAAAKLACSRYGVPLASDTTRYAGAEGFWAKQRRLGRANCVDRGPLSDIPGWCVQYVLSCPPPASLAGQRKRRRR